MFVWIIESLAFSPYLNESLMKVMHIISRPSPHRVWGRLLRMGQVMFQVCINWLVYLMSCFIVPEVLKFEIVANPQQQHLKAPSFLKLQCQNPAPNNPPLLLTICGLYIERLQGWHLTVYKYKLSTTPNHMLNPSLSPSSNVPQPPISSPCQATI